MIQARQIFRNTAAMTLADLVTRGGSMLLCFLIARMLQADGLGIYSTAMAYYGLIAVASGMGAQDFLVREIARDPDETNRYVVHTSVVGLAVSSGVMAVFSLILPHLGYSAELASSTGVVILAIIPGTLNLIQKAVFVAHQRVEFVLYTRLLGTLVNVVLSVFLLARGYGVVSLLVAFVVVEYLVMFCFFLLISRYIARFRWQFEFSFARKLLWEMRVFAALSLLSALFARPEVIILSLVSDEEEIGYYSAASKLVGFWYLVSQIYMTNVYPVLSRSYRLAEARFQIIQDKSIKYLLAISLPLTAGMIGAAAPAIRLFYGPGFEAAVLPLQVMALSIPLAYVSAVLWRVLAARDRQDAVLWVRIITLGTRLGGGYLMARWWGVLGASLSVLVNMLLNTLLLAVHVRRSGIRLRFMALGWRFALAAMVMGVLVWAVAPQLSLWLLVLIAAVVYGGLVLVLKGFDAEDLALFREVWQPRKSHQQHGEL
jgi:O-antigen/teichoic acid export membrane protein